jgi:hypothetical protein
VKLQQLNVKIYSGDIPPVQTFAHKFFPMATFLSFFNQTVDNDTFLWYASTKWLKLLLREGGATGDGQNNTWTNSLC